MRFINNKFSILKTFVVLTVLVGIPTNAQWDPKNPIVREILGRSKAADMKAWMDPNVDPCDNFYTFSCGTWDRINSANTAKAFSTDNFQGMAKILQRKFHKLLTQPNKGNFILEKLQDFYGSCLQTKSKQSDYILALKKLYNEYGEFSFFKKDNGQTQTNFNWWLAIADIHKTYGKSIILSLDVQVDFKYGNRSMLYIGPAEFYMSRAASLIQQYLNVHFRVSDYQAENVLKFEWKLSQGATGNSLGLEELLTLYQTTDLIEKYKDLLDFDRFLKLALNTTQLPEQVYLYDEKYLENLRDVFASTETSTVEDYILWQLLDEYLIEEHLIRVDLLVWENWCGEKSKKYFGKFIDYTLYEKNRTEENEREVLQVWRGIKDTFREGLQGDKYLWMSNNTRQEAIKKLDKMNLTINSYDEENFEEFYRNLTIDPNNYVANIQNILKRVESMRGNKLEMKHEGIADTELLSFTPVYNAFTNVIKIPVSLLQPYVVWHPVYPKAIKYATIGFLLAHEMIHGFDDEGRQYDSQGQTNNWWDEQSVQEFQKRRTCFQRQYHSYIYDGQPLPSRVKQPENIADNAAIKLAFTAYTRWLESEKYQPTYNESREHLINFPYNNSKLFFLSFSQLWCGDVHTTKRTKIAMDDIHAPAIYRVIGTLSNFGKFSDVFNCTFRRYMNPVGKCEIY